MGVVFSASYSLIMAKYENLYIWKNHAPLEFFLFFFQMIFRWQGEVVIEVFARKSSELPCSYSLKLFFPHM